jgi:hypothetical protein
VLHIKILSLQYPERYVVRRMVTSAQQEMQPRYPDLELEIIEIDDPGQIGKYASVLILPTLVIDEQVVCSGRFPGREEILAWLQKAVEKQV